MTRIRTWVVAATTRSTNHYTITADGKMGLNVNQSSLASGAEKHKNASPAGNRTPVFRVTGGDTHHYTTEDDEQSGCKMQMKLQFSTRQKEKRHSRAGKQVQKMVKLQYTKDIPVRGIEPRPRR